tara:strand:- start:790 stop:1131 length:342 start_codon:yes stop_codon:yes gene_type:complete
LTKPNSWVLLFAARGNEPKPTKKANMKNTITGKVELKRNGSFKTFVYELDGETLRKSHRYYPLGFRYGNKEWTFGKAPNSVLAKRFQTEVYQVIWQDAANEFLPETARKEASA